MTHPDETLLQLDIISKHFGGLSALSEVSLHIKQGEIYGLIGPNGEHLLFTAGKCASQLCATFSQA